MRPAYLIALLPLVVGCSTLRDPHELTWQAAHVVDMALTVDGVAHPCVHEAHPITRRVIGRHPSTPEIVAYGVGSSLMHLGISHALRDRYPRTYRWWQYVSITDTTVAAGLHIKLGIRPGRDRVKGVGCD